MSKTKKEVLLLAEKKDLRLREDSFTMNESGLDFQVVFAKDVEEKEWILRLPRREDVFIRTAPEKTVLDFIRKRVDFEVPDWEIYTKKLIAYKALKGVPAATVDMEMQAYVWEIDAENVSESFIQTLGKALAELHRIPSEQAAQAGIKVQTAKEVRQHMKERMDKIKETYDVEETLWNRWQVWLNDDTMWPNKTGMIHGDLHPGHIMVDKKENVTGLIDWTEAKVADISKDFIGHFTVFGGEGLDRLIQSYKAAGGYYWPNMKEHIIELNTTAAIDIAEFAIISGLEEYEQMAKQALGLAGGYDE
ncbi:macrolide 2'-phosphotransferase [Desemzia sp. RIT804]|uniref:macrolide 2'-phosphotransferase n=1 Tax=Desemzia sp. RIT 804 TaxID=2810209 RepID=UPI00194F156C|nr:macrolide 2'-phosphotransferase [Desemzia sp. RIT 804]MBM6614620.1 macrolide 2'-phosphotransferase [Desemzia sp. RIT 804]